MTDLTEQQREAFIAAWNSRPWWLHDPTDKEIAEYWFKQGCNSTPVPEGWPNAGTQHEATEALAALDRVIGSIGAGADPSLLNKVEIERRDSLLLARNYILNGATHD